ncbi:MAG: hypothetical protein WBE72_09630 [Terracidiphilus sp.]
MSHRILNLPRTLVVAVGVLTLAAAPAAFCQALNSNTASVSLTATLNESLTVAATPSAVTFALVSGGTATGSAPVAMTTTWVMNASRATVTLTGYFSSATAALTSGGSSPVNIPTSEVLGQVTTGAPTTYTAFTQTPATGGVGVTGASLVLVSQAITAANRASTRSDNLNLEINLASQTQLPAGTYTGTLNLQAQAL